MSLLPKVSIVITNYNYERYIGNAIESCLQQDYQGAIEVIVVDDRSSDNSVMFVNRHFGSKVKLIALKQNSGYSVAKNEGIAQSTGDLITTIDADDMMTIDSLKTRVEILTRFPQMMVVHAQAYTIFGDGDYLYWIKRLRKISVSKRTDKVHAQTVMVRREVYQKYGLYDEKLRSRADNEMWWRLRNVAKIGESFYYLEYPVAFYRKHELSMIEYRKRNPRYNFDVSQKLEQQKETRLREGITKANTRMLKK